MGIFAYSPTARRNLRQIGAFLSGRGPLAAVQFVDEIDRTCQMLADNPRAGRARSELPGRRTRSWSGYIPYVIHYRPSRGGVYVVRILDGRQDLSSLVRGRKR